MSPQPILLITISTGEEILINENQVVKIQQGNEGCALVTLSTGETLVVKQPNYQAWENDYLTRKF